jgi:hypothetical protein
MTITKTPSWVPQAPSLTAPPVTPQSPGVPSETETWRERVFAALPLFVVGGLCAVLTAYFYFVGTTAPLGASNPAFVRPWVLFAALAFTGFSAGIVALLIEDLPEGSQEKPKAPESRPAPVRAMGKTPGLLGRSRTSYPGPTLEERPKVAVSSGRTTLVAPMAVGPKQPATSRRTEVRPRAWDESSNRAVEATTLPKEDWDESSEEFERAASKPAPTDFVLSQIDELEKSLRRKSTPPRAD